MEGEAAEMAEGIRVNPSLIPVACNRVVSVSWDGRINIMLGNLLQLPERLGGSAMSEAAVYPVQASTLPREAALDLAQAILRILRTVDEMDKQRN